jgi:hypothetical protein
MCRDHGRSYVYICICMAPLKPRAADHRSPVTARTAGSPEKLSLKQSIKGLHKSLNPCRLVFAMFSAAHTARLAQMLFIRCTLAHRQAHAWRPTWAHGPWATWPWRCELRVVGCGAVVRWARANTATSCPRQDLNKRAMSKEMFACACAHFFWRRTSHFRLPPPAAARWRISRDALLQAASCKVAAVNDEAKKASIAWNLCDDATNVRFGALRPDTQPGRQTPPLAS